MSESVTPAPADIPIASGDPTAGTSQTRYDATDLTFALQRVSYLIARDLDHGPRVEGLQDHQLWVLAALQIRPRSMGELATLTRTTQANISGMVSRLESRGLVRRATRPADRRVVEVALTEEGRLALADVRGAFARRADAVLRDLSDEERVVLTDLLGRAAAPEE